MRRFCIACGLVAALAAGLAAATARPARAEGGNFGAGLIIGSPTGLSLKYYFAGGNAVDAAIGGALAGDQGLSVHADYLWTPSSWVVREEAFDLGIYFGVGGRILDHERSARVGNDVHVGVRGPVGIVFDFNKRNVPIDVFLEAALILDFRSGNDEDRLGLDANAGIGVRYYF